MKLGKNIFLCVFAVAMAMLCLFALPQEANAASTSDLTFTLNSAGDGYIVSDCNTSARGEMVIPATYNGLPVTAIGDRAFYGCRNINYITIPESVTSIGEHAFFDCSELTGITIPNSVTCIGAHAFMECRNLTSITIPDSVTSIGEPIFFFCGNLTNLQVEAGNTIYHSAGNCIIETASKTLVAGCKTSQIPSDGSVTSIGRAAFSAYTSLTSIAIPDGVTSINEYAFYECIGLTSIDIPNSITSIGSSAFEDCLSLSKVIYCGTQEQWDAIQIGDSNDHLKNATRQFHNYENNICTICQYYLPLTFTLNSAGDGYIVSDCDTSASGEMVIPATYNGKPVTSIGNGAFSGCTGLTSVTIPDSVTSIGSSAFWDCSNLTSVTIENGVTSIGAHAFHNCASLTSITIPDSVTSIANDVFDGCTGLMGIWASENNANYASDEIGALFNKDKTQLLYFPAGFSGSYTIPDSVTGIDDTAFYGCTKLTSITIMEGVTSIGWGTFNGCTSLTSVTIPDSVTSINEYAFSRCTSLTSITIPDGVTSINEYAFSRCTSLTSVTIPDSVTSIGDYAFECCSSLTKVIYCGTQAQWDAIQIDSGNYPLENATRQFHNYENNICTICQQYNGPLTFTLNSAGDGYIVSGCDTSASGELVIPSTYNGKPVTGIDHYAFSHCTSLTSVTIPDSVTSVSGYFFRGCASLTTLRVEEGNPVYHSAGNCIIETNSKKLVAGCQSSQIPDDGTVTSIGGSAFAECTGLTSLTIPDSVTRIEELAFGNCSNLTSVTFGQNVTRLYNYVLSGCTALTTLQVKEGNPVFHSDGNCIIQTDSKTLVLGCQSSQIPTDGTVTNIGEGAFDCCTGLTSITIPDSVTSIYFRAFSFCDNLSKVIYCGTQEQWDAIQIDSGNEPLENATLQFHNYENDICTICQHRNYIFGDMDKSGVVDQDDAVYLLLHTMFGEAVYPLNGMPADIDGSGIVDQDDAVYLLLHTMFGEAIYPLNQT